MNAVTYGTPRTRGRKVWFHGFTYNVTPGSRTQLSNPATDTLRNGMPLWYDPEAYTDRDSLPSGMQIRGAGTGGLTFNVTKAATGILGLFAGIVTGLPPEGLRPDLEAHEGGYMGGVEVEVIDVADQVDAFILGDMSSAGYDTILGGVNAQWYLGIVALGTNGANLPNIVAKPLIRTNVAAAAKHPIRVGVLGHGFA